VKLLRWFTTRCDPLALLADLTLALWYLMHPGEYERAVYAEEHRAAAARTAHARPFSCSNGLPEPVITP
jgi:hypothetical protein